ncbi:hypothetical protein [Flavobacterium foetidum]|uniref:hypothetical protein n=1 Tax=Flavobacterium foetidum TaxID=2026681 RepID=UPI001074BCC1|nr:hypothetical protein [Flavobacterium foetidum]KAF2507399.1 hypothetical protein E0W73_20510 [Flavobacterium foetidum]
MEKTAKFVVIINDNVFWMANKALQFYSNLFGETQGAKYAQEKLSESELFKIQNDFSVEILMVYDRETPQSFAKLDSSRLSNQNVGALKPINLSETIYFATSDIMVLLKRAEEIARQRKHDLIWVKAFAVDTDLIETLKSFDYEDFSFEESIAYEQLYFRKKLS